METKHTKGSWAIIHDFNVISKSDNRMVAQTACYSTNTDNGEHVEENKANAKLIAAAPEMLEALHFFANEFRGGEYGDYAKSIIKLATE